VLEIKDRTTISSSTTLPQDEHDYEAALTFMLSEATRLTGQLRREQMQAREFSLAIRFKDFTEVGTSFRFNHPQFLNSVINAALEAMFREIMAGQPSGAPDSDCDVQSGTAGHAADVVGADA
jgi:nucleotidyltransferase/DNA polymerase involved in DNA repair